MVVVFFSGAVGLLAAMAAADTGRENQRLAARGEVTYSAQELDELRFETDLARNTAFGLAVVSVLAGGAAAVRAAQQRGTAPTNRWPAKLSFPTGDLAAFDASPTLAIAGDRVWSADGSLVATVSHRIVPWSYIRVSTYWIAPGISDFSVHEVAGRRYLTSWRSPLLGRLEEGRPNGSPMTLYENDQAIGVLEELFTPGLPTRYVLKDKHDAVIGEISRRGNRWDCMVPSDASAVTRRLLCVAAGRAEDRYRQLKADD